MDKSEVFKSLKEDYALRSSLRRKNLLVQEELEDEIDDLEQSYITTCIMPQLEAYAKDLLKDMECELYLAIMKDATGVVQVKNEYVDSNQDIAEPPLSDTYETLGISEDVPNSPELPSFSNIITRKNIQDADSHDLRITIDGKVYQDKNAIATFIHVLQHIGLDNVARVGIICSGYNLVDTRKRTDGNRKWQKKVDGKWIYVYFSNPTKCKFLFQIADYLHKDIKIEAV